MRRGACGKSTGSEVDGESVTAHRPDFHFVQDSPIRLYAKALSAKEVAERYRTGWDHSR